MNKLKIALVKQEVYQDLYVCPVTEKDPGQILFSSMDVYGPHSTNERPECGFLD